MNIGYGFNNNVGLAILMAFLFLWTIAWKAYAIWTAVKNGHKKWFIALLILNTFGILEIFYVFKVAKKSWVEVKTSFNKALSSIFKK